MADSPGGCRPPCRQCLVCRDQSRDYNIDADMATSLRFRIVISGGTRTRRAVDIENMGWERRKLWYADRDWW